MASLFSSLIYLKILMSLTDTVFFFSFGAINFLRSFSVVSSSKLVLATVSTNGLGYLSLWIYVIILFGGLCPLFWPFLSISFMKSLFSSCFLKSVLTVKAKGLLALVGDSYLFASVLVVLWLQQELVSEPFDELWPKSLGA